MTTCEGCGCSYEDGFNFCPHCGKPKPIPKILNESKKMACKSCGNFLGNNFKGEYCPKCGTYLFQKCLQCGQANWWENEFCEKCGVKLSDAKFILSDSRASAWSGHFHQFQGYFQLYDKDRKIIKTKKMSKAFQSINPPMNPNKSIVIFGVPIQEKEWCIDRFIFRNRVIWEGLFYVYPDRVGIVDCERGQGITLNHCDLQKASLTDGNSLELCWKNEDPMKIRFRLPSVKLAMAGDIAESLIGVMVGSAIASMEDMDDPVNRIRRDINENRNSRSYDPRNSTTALQNEVENYICSIFNLFKEIIDTLNDRTKQ